MFLDAFQLIEAAIISYRMIKTLTDCRFPRAKILREGHVAKADQSSDLINELLERFSITSGGGPISPDEILAAVQKDKPSPAATRNCVAFGFNALKLHTVKGI